MTQAQPASYTPEVVKRIRNEAPSRSRSAIAESLHWNVPRLERIAAKHNIPLAGNPSDTPAVIEEPIARRAVSLGLDDHNLDALAEALDGNILALLRMLAKLPPNESLRVHLISARLGIPNKSVFTIVRRLRGNLSPLGWGIKSSLGEHGGYRLVSHARKDSSPCKQEAVA